MKENPSYEELMTPFLEVQKQGGFVSYNHPGWLSKNSPHELFLPIHQKLLDKGILKSVELVNNQHYNINAHRIAMKYNLTFLSGTDAHSSIPPPSATYHRPMTLVFAKDKTEAAIREALESKRTAIYTENFVIARQPEAEAFFKASISVSAEKVFAKNVNQIVLKIKNNFDISYNLKLNSPYDIDDLPSGKVTLAPNSTTTLTLYPVWEYPAKFNISAQVENVLVSVEKCLETNIAISF